MLKVKMEDGVERYDVFLNGVVFAREVEEIEKTVDGECVQLLLLTDVVDFSGGEPRKSNFAVYVGGEYGDIDWATFEDKSQALRFIKEFGEAK